jgi:hypothetical protein
MPISLDTVITRSPEVLFQNFDGEGVLLDLASQSYFGLNPVGMRIWELLEQSQPLRATVDTLASEYAVEHERLEADLLALVDQLAQAGLVTLPAA